MMTSEELRVHLKEGIVNVTFTKLNGDKREMNCTTSIEEGLKVEGDKTISREIDPDLFKVTEITEDGIKQWRSFNYNQVTSVEV